MASGGRQSQHPSSVPLRRRREEPAVDVEEEEEEGLMPLVDEDRSAAAAQYSQRVSRVWTRGTPAGEAPRAAMAMGMARLPSSSPAPQAAAAAAATSAATPSPRVQQGTPAQLAPARAALSPPNYARPTKRARRSPQTMGKDEAGAAAASAAAAAAAAVSAAAQAALQAQAQHKDNLQCVVCQELPPDEIFQCDHGHLMCKYCHSQIVKNRPLCPVCRVRLSVDHPSRNRFAELVKADLRVPCNQPGCNEQVRFSDLPMHMEQSCGFRQTICIYQPLGCNWRGIANLNAQHENECPIKSYSAKKVLQLVKARNEEHEEDKRAIERRGATYQHLCHMLSRKCRDMTIRDLIIEQQPSGSKVTNVFTACNIRWEVYLDSLDEGASPEVKIHLRIVDSIRHKVTVEVFCLRGPSLGYDFTPVLRRVSFKAGVTQSESFPLPFTPEEARDVHNLSAVGLRLGFVDVTPGVISASFTTHNLSLSEREQQEMDAAAARREDSDAEDDSLMDEEPIELPLRRSVQYHARPAPRFAAHLFAADDDLDDGPVELDVEALQSMQQNRVQFDLRLGLVSSSSGVGGGRAEGVPQEQDDLQLHQSFDSPLLGEGEEDEEEEDDGDADGVIVNDSEADSGSQGDEGRLDQTPTWHPRG